MANIFKPGETVTFTVGQQVSVPSHDHYPSAWYLSDGNIIYADSYNGGTSTVGWPFKLSWEGSNDISFVTVTMVIPDNARRGNFSGHIHPTGINGDIEEAFFMFQIRNLTGTVSVSKVLGLQVCVDLKADASKGQKVINAEIDWGDGNTTTVSPAPNTQHYFGGNICHTYTTTDAYTITATYQDDDSHTIHPDTEVTVDCINSASMAIQSTGSSNGKSPIKGIYTHCYTATVSHSTAAGESFSYDWTFPDNTTVNSGGGSSDQTASFCIATADINGQSNFGVVSCKITKTTPAPSCDVTVSGQIASPGGPPPPPPPPGPPPGDPPGAPGNPPC